MLPAISGGIATDVFIPRQSDRADVMQFFFFFFALGFFVSLKERLQTGKEEWKKTAVGGQNSMVGRYESQGEGETRRKIGRGKRGKTT